MPSERLGSYITSRITRLQMVMVILHECEYTDMSAYMHKHHIGTSCYQYRDILYLVQVPSFMQLS